VNYTHQKSNGIAQAALRQNWPSETASLKFRTKKKTCRSFKPKKKEPREEFDPIQGEFRTPIVTGVLQINMPNSSLLLVKLIVNHLPQILRCLTDEQPDGMLVSLGYDLGVVVFVTLPFCRKETLL